MDSVSSVLRKHYADLYKTLVKSNTSRSSVTISLYSADIITGDERDRIKEDEKLHGAVEATDEILKRIEAHLRVYPDKIGIVLDILGGEEVLQPTVIAMRGKLNLPAPDHQATATNGQGASNGSQGSPIAASTSEIYTHTHTIIQCSSHAILLSVDNLC